MASLSHKALRDQRNRIVSKLIKTTALQWKLPIAGVLRTSLIGEGLNLSQEWVDPPSFRWNRVREVNHAFA